MPSSKSTKKTAPKSTEEVRVSPETVVAAGSTQPLASPQKRVKTAVVESTSSKPRTLSTTRHRTVKAASVPVPALAMAAAAGANSATISTPAFSPVTSERIAELAYSYWAARGYQGGSPHEDWVRAEHELHSLVVA